MSKRKKLKDLTIRDNFMFAAVMMELFLRFIKEDSATSDKHFEGNFTKQIQESMNDVKKNRELENRHMTLEEYLEDEKVLMGLEIRREYIIDILEEFGEVSKSLYDQIMAEDEVERLKIHA